MVLIATIGLAIAVYVLYTMMVNRSFLRCPHCGKIGAWRFDDLGEPRDECDEDGSIIRSEVQQICRRCGGQVVHIWSDYEGREIRKTE